MSKQTNIHDFVDRLIVLTNEDKCKWEYTIDKDFRLLLKSGSVILSAVYDEVYEDFDYALSLYDSTDCFATYRYSIAEEGKESAMWNKLQDLHIAINNSENRIIESKISQLFEELG